MADTNRRAALVTGGRRGIGRATAYALAAAGFDTVINDLRHDHEVETTLTGVVERGGRARFIAQDVSDLAGQGALVEQAFAAFERLDCLVNNAGVQVPVRGDMLEVTPEEFDRVLGVNLRGTFFLTQAVARRMIADRPGAEGRSIITLTSANAFMVSEEKAHYCISKAALSMAVQLFAVRLARHGIPAFEVRPGLIATDMTADVRKKYGERIEAGLTPIRRWGEPDEVARAVAALATGVLPFTTGHAINIDGGLQIVRL